MDNKLIIWEKWKIEKETITAKLGNPAKVRYGAKAIEFDIKKGEKIIVDGNLKIKDRY